MKNDRMEETLVPEYSPDEKKLLDRMRLKTPVLVLGAGFSFGVKNRKGQEIPSGQSLSNILFSNVLKKSKKVPKEYIDDYETTKDELRKTCDHIENEGLNKERNNLLINIFSGCKCDEDDYHMLIRNYPWRVIYTLNIDDLLENIYCKEGTVGNRPNIHVIDDSKVDAEASLDIYKLHGSVKRPELGFVFNSSEYQNFTVRCGRALSTFGYHYTSSDVIFLGTEFQEDDLKTMIAEWENKAETINEPHYFFISPKIRDSVLKRKIERPDNNMHFIPWTTEQFLKCINEEIHIPEEKRRKLQDFGMVFYNEELQRAKGKPMTQTPELYYGEAPRPVDFLQNYDFIRPNIHKMKNVISNSKDDHVVVLYGESYVGKTCAALRMGVDLTRSGYEFCVYNLSFGIDASVYLNHIIEYLKMLPKKTNVVIMAENMPYYYKYIKKIMRRKPEELGQLVIICTANIEDHQIKKYILNEYETTEDVIIDEIRITEETKDYKFAKNIYEKLYETNHLNKLRSMAETENEYIKLIRGVNDVIDVLYMAHEGRKFEEYFKLRLEDKIEGEESKAFLLICLFSMLGIHEIPKSFFISLAGQCMLNFCFAEFTVNYKDFLKLSNQSIKLRCSRTIRAIMRPELGKQDVLEWIRISVVNLAGELYEHELSIRMEIFQKILKVKTIRRYLPLSDDEIMSLIIEMEPYCKHLSYYWVQRGIIQRDMLQFEEADNAFSEADSIRNNTSNHIKHAKAKNYMTWGIWAVENEYAHSQYYFERGRELIESIIHNSGNMFYSYSAHTLIDMMIRYYEARNEQMPQGEINEIVNLLIRWPDIQVDSLAPKLEERFQTYCKKIHNPPKTLQILREKYRRVYNDTYRYSLVEFDSDDIDEDTIV